jgi:antitoxin PrlF
MWKDAVLSAKGQVTVPKEIRDALGIQANDKIVFTIEDGRLILTPKNVDFADLAGFLGSPPNGPATLDEIEDTIASAASHSASQPLKKLKGHAA